MKGLDDELEFSRVWNRHNEDRSIYYITYFLFQGLLCITNAILGYFILIYYHDQLTEYNDNMIVLVITIFGELFIHLVSIFLILFIHIFCGIRSSIHFISVISLINLALQFTFYYICFLISIITLIIWYFNIKPQSNTFFIHFLLDKRMKDDLVHKIIIYFIIEAIISSMEVLSSIPTLLNLIIYVLLKVFDKIRGKPIVEFYKVKEPVIYTKYQNYEKAFENLNVKSDESKHHYIQLSNV